MSFGSNISVSFLDTPEAGRMKTTVWHLNCPIIYYCYNFTVYIMFTGWPNAPGHHLNRLRCTCICPVVAWCLCPVSDTQTYNYQGLGEGQSHYFQNWTKQRKKEIVSFSKISLWMSYLVKLKTNYFLLFINNLSTHLLKFNFKHFKMYKHVNRLKRTQFALISILTTHFLTNNLQNVWWGLM